MNKFVESLGTSNNNEDGENSCIWQFKNTVKSRRFLLGDELKKKPYIKRELDIIEYFLKNFNKYSFIIEEDMKREATKSEDLMK